METLCHEHILTESGIIYIYIEREKVREREREKSKTTLKNGVDIICNFFVLKIRYIKANS